MVKNKSDISYMKNINELIDEAININKENMEIINDGIDAIKDQIILVKKGNMILIGSDKKIIEQKIGIISQDNNCNDDDVVQ